MDIDYTNATLSILQILYDSFSNCFKIMCELVLNLGNHFLIIKLNSFRVHLYYNIMDYLWRLLVLSIQQKQIRSWKILE